MATAECKAFNKSYFIEKWTFAFNNTTEDRKQYINVIEEAQLSGNTEKYDRFTLNAYIRSMNTYIEMFDKKSSDIQANKLLKISEFTRAADFPVRIPVAKTDNDYMLFSKEQIEEIK
ncbi:MAG: hypothetical protein LBS61_04700 [Endomicrobium sp.]|jgi:hypothetical protein|nr:hypothetical protein [Endomicrobium sp.]